MQKIFFVTVANHVCFTVPTREAMNQVIKHFLALQAEVTATEDRVLFGRDAQDQPVSMVKVSQVIGFYAQEVPSDDPARMLANAQSKIAKVIEKEARRGEEWNP